MVSRAVVWLAVTSAPLVTVEIPIRPEIGAVTRVKFRLMRAASTAALSCWTVAWACLNAASASSAS